MEEDAEKITIRLPKKYLRRIDFLVAVDDFPSRSEVIRTAVRDFIYERIKVVVERTKEMQQADVTLDEMERIEKEYLKR